MAISIVQIGTHQSATALNSQPYSFPTLPAVGNAIFTLVTCWNDDWAAGEVTDNQGHAAQVLDANRTLSGNTATAAIYRLNKVTTSSGTFTVTVNPGGASNYFEFVCVEVAGLLDTAAQDVNSLGTGTNDTPVLTSPATTTQADELLLGVCGVTDSSSADIGIDVPSGWTVLGAIIQNPSSTIGFMAAYKITTATQVLNFTGGTLSRTPGSGWALACASYKGAAAEGVYPHWQRHSDRPILRF